MRNLAHPAKCSPYFITQHILIVRTCYSISSNVSSRGQGLLIRFGPVAIFVRSQIFFVLSPVFILVLAISRDQDGLRLTRSGRMNECRTRTWR